jgi:hypothetical protein
MLKANRINEFDVVVFGPRTLLLAFGSALSKAGLKTWKLSDVAIQVSFDGAPELRAQLPPVDTEYEIQRPLDGSGANEASQSPADRLASPPPQRVGRDAG